MGKFFARSILLLSFVTTALSLFPQGIVSKDQPEIADSMTSIVQNVHDVVLAFGRVHSGSGISDLMAVHNALFSTKQSEMVAIQKLRVFRLSPLYVGIGFSSALYVQGASSVSEAVEQTCLARMQEAAATMATGLDDFQNKAALMDEIYPGAVTEGCNSLKDLYRNFITLASLVEGLSPSEENRKELEAGRDDILGKLSATIGSTCAGKPVKSSNSPLSRPRRFEANARDPDRQIPLFSAELLRWDLVIIALYSSADGNPPPTAVDVDAILSHCLGTADQIARSALAFLILVPMRTVRPMVPQWSPPAARRSLAEGPTGGGGQRWNMARFMSMGGKRAEY
ncbi:hypothetical protein GGX14DRAFT_635583 [Mycena pura]|uniref:Uncharacterized protein n=1 Tax=Mycena pura TaxID=153505 RepID=A0AAD6YFT1_9AGAR|nr:hypothetical protein GGX14DRAFT_635583 [Mycena pura]